MADLDAGWERFRADIRGSREITDPNQKPKLQFHIPIRPQAARYRPGSGPPPPRVNLRPVHDSSAFIVDKVVLPQGPFLPPNTSSSRPRQRRCYYIIGWPDLPAARPVVDASRVLDYVSPRTLEDWEYTDALRREEAAEAEARALAKGKGVALLQQQPGGARPGRPPKSRMMVDEPPSEPELNSEQEELIHKRMRGPSLSTPRKSRLALLEAEVEMLEGLDDATDEDALPAPPQTPLLGALGDGWSEGANTSDRDVKRGVVEDLDGLRLSSAAPGMSSRDSSRASSARPADRASAPATSAASTARQQKYPISTTPIPLPSAFSRMMNWRPKAKTTSGASTTTISQPKVVVAQLDGSAPTHPQSDPIHGQHSSPAVLSSHTNGFTPIGGTFPRPPKRPADGSPHSDNTPATPKQGKSRKKKKKHADLPLAYPDELAEPAAAGPPNPAALDLAQGEQEYIVKRLEGDQVIDGIHWFRVRWEGDWPEEDNPTWEPRENIAERLVKQYLRRKARREADKAASSTTRKKKKKASKTTRQQANNNNNPLVDQAKAYGSVLEVFEGQVNLDGPGGGDMDLDQGDDAQYEYGDVHPGGDGHDELFVIDQDKELVDIERRRAAQAELATQLAGMARSAPRHF